MQFNDNAVIELPDYLPYLDKVIATHSYVFF